MHAEPDQDDPLGQAQPVPEAVELATKGHRAQLVELLAAEKVPVGQRIGTNIEFGSGLNEPAGTAEQDEVAALKYWPAEQRKQISV